MLVVALAKEAQGIVTRRRRSSKRRTLEALLRSLQEGFSLACMQGTRALQGQQQGRVTIKGI